MTRLVIELPDGLFVTRNSRGIWVHDQHAKASTFPGSSIGQLAELRVKLARMAELVEARVEHG